MAVNFIPMVLETIFHWFLSREGGENSGSLIFPDRLSGCRSNCMLNAHKVMSGNKNWLLLKRDINLGMLKWW